MPTSLLALLGLIIMGMGVLGLLTGKVIAGSKGLRPNYFSRQHQPFLHYLFVTVYLAIGIFVLFHSLA